MPAPTPSRCKENGSRHSDSVTSSALITLIIAEARAFELALFVAVVRVANTTATP